MRQERQLARLRAEVDRGRVLERAKGVLIERLGCTQGQADDHLADLAKRAGLPLLEIAADISGGTPVESADVSGGTPVESPASSLRLQRAESAAALAADGTALADALFANVLAHAGAVAAMFWVLEPDGVLHLAGQHGLHPVEAARWRCLPPDMPTVGRLVLADRQPRWLSDGLASDGLAAGVLAPAAARWPGGARAVLPLTHRRTVLGVLEVCWPSRRAEFSTAERAQLVAVAELCAHALAPAEKAVAGVPPWLTGLLDALVDNVILTRAVRADDGTVVDFVVEHAGRGAAAVLGRRELVGRTLLQLHPLISGDGGLFTRMRDVLATGSPYRADTLVMPTLVHGHVTGPVIDIRVAPLADGVAIAVRRHGEPELAAEALRLTGTGGWEDNLLTGRTTWTAQTFDLLDTLDPVSLRELAAQVEPLDQAGIDRFLNVLTTGNRPASVEFTLPTDDGDARRLRAVARPVTDAAGSVVAIRGAVRGLAEPDLAAFALSAAHDQLTDAERQVDRQQRLAVRLQQAIIAPAPPPIELSGLQVVVRYRPAGNQYRVGGDWYDALRLPAGQVLLGVGDMVGHGIDVVTGMITMRNALRGLAMTGASPAHLLGWLNETARTLPEPVWGTAICACYDPATATLRWARAGHLPPLLVRDGVAEFLPLPDGIMFGATDEPGYTDVDTVLRQGDVLVLFTDGLVERRGENLDDGLDRLLTAAHHLDDDLDRYSNRLLDNIEPNSFDDTCLVVVRVES
jgi:serine phosphatase RsbU (regulator of sigma subunit)/GAF domain-containing protein